MFSIATKGVGRVSGRIEYIIPGSYTFTVPSGVSSIRATLVGGGGGGGGGAISGGGIGGGGGGSAGAIRGTLPVQANNTISVSVAPRGGPNGAGADPGGTSTLTSGSNVLSAAGGGPGQAASQSTGGPGGTTSVSGNWTVLSTSNGLPGENGTSTFGGAGGNRTAFFGVSGSGAPRDTVSGGTAAPATGFGAGGAGSYDSLDQRGAASQGYVLIEWGF